MLEHLLFVKNLGNFGNCINDLLSMQVHWNNVLSNLHAIKGLHEAVIP